MAKLILMVGLPFHGKTTRAKELEKEYNAIRFTPDEWQIRLFGNEYPHPEHNKRHETIEQIMVELGFELLQKGVNVILDFGFWSKEERKFYKDKAEAMGFDFAMCYCKYSEDELIKRLEKRNKENAAKGMFVITIETYNDFAKLFQEPSADEGNWI